MIEFKIMAAPDRTQVASYRHASPELSFGRSEGDMLIDDAQLPPLAVRVRAEGGAFVLENVGGGEVKLNGKLIEGAAPVKEKDVLLIGRTTINFTRLDLAPASPPERYEHPQRNTRFAEGTRDKAILDVLETLAKREGAGKPPTPGAPPRPPGRS